MGDLKQDLLKIQKNEKRDTEQLKKIQLDVSKEETKVYKFYTRI